MCVCVGGEVFMLGKKAVRTDVKNVQVPGLGKVFIFVLFWVEGKSVRLFVYN